VNGSPLLLKKPGADGNRKGNGLSAYSKERGSQHHSYRRVPLTVKGPMQRPPAKHGLVTNRETATKEDGGVLVRLPNSKKGVRRIDGGKKNKYPAGDG